MVERGHSAHVATFYAPGAWRATVTLGEGPAHHAQVKRLSVGDVVQLTSGDGRRGRGIIERLSRKAIDVALDEQSVSSMPVYPRVDLHVPIGDRERMLMLAEKAVELGASSWQGVLFARSRSVTPRGEGDSFHQKLRARQVAALEQSGNPWLPDTLPDATLDALTAVSPAIEALPIRLVLDMDGERMADVLTSLTAPVAITLGPEGGLEEGERARLIQAGWRPVSLAANVLRFETAAIAALAIVRSHLGS